MRYAWHPSIGDQAKIASRWVVLFFALGLCTHLSIHACRGAEALQVGIASTDITPPVGYPMSGYFHARHATGVLDPLQAKAIVFRQGERQAAIVVCDILGIAYDLAQHVRRRAAQKIGIPIDAIMIAGTHSHTGPDYYRELFTTTEAELNDRASTAYVPHLVEQMVAAIVAAHDNCRPMELQIGTSRVHDVSYNRRFVVNDGSIRTWANFRDPNVVRAAGPIDPELKFVLFREPSTNATRGALTTFALHLDTTGGTELSADYPAHMQRVLRERFDADFLLVFGAGTCGDINHVDPRSSTRRSPQEIGGRLAEALWSAVPEVHPLQPDLEMTRTVLQLPLQNVTAEQIADAQHTLKRIADGQSVEMLKHVEATRVMRLDALRNGTETGATDQPAPRKLSRSLVGSGETLPIEVQAIRLARDTAIVGLPGEVFVDLGLAIKCHSPFAHTIVLELANSDDIAYVPTAYAAQGGGYEVINSALEPGSGERMASAAIELLRTLSTNGTEEENAAE